MIANKQTSALSKCKDHKTCNKVACVFCDKFSVSLYNSILGNNSCI